MKLEGLLAHLEQTVQNARDLLFPLVSIFISDMYYIGNSNTGR